MIRRLLPAMAWLALAPLALACSRADLEPSPPPPPPSRNDALTVEGSLCTRAPDPKAFPLRVLFVVDASESMAVTDPPDPATGITQRERAVRETWTRLLRDGGGAVKIGVIRFSAQARSRTVVDTDGDGLPESFFTDAPDLLEAATTALGVTDRTTNYANALDEAYFEIRNELLGADAESLPRSRYAVIFLSDGLPDETGAEARRNGVDALTEAAAGLRELTELFGVGDFALHTVYLSTDRGVVLDRPAQALLQGMAEAGGGTWRSVPNGERLEFLTLGLSSLRRVYSLGSLVAINLQALQAADQRPTRALDAIDDVYGFKDLLGDGGLDCGDPLVDTDGDGLADVVELRIGTDPLVGDSDGDGLSDRIEWGLRSSGLDPLDGADSGCYVPEVADGSCRDADADGLCDCPDDDGDGACDYGDADGDGLGDCEELFAGTLQALADSDGDGLPDLVEVRAGTSPVAPEGRQDLDWDGTADDIEVRTGGDPRCDDAATRSRAAWSATVEQTGRDGERACYAFRVDPITLLPTRAGDGSGYPGDGINRVLVFAGEAAVDEPGRTSGWRVACVEARYEVEGDRKVPPSGRSRLVDDDFVALEQFDPAVHCAGERGL